MYSGFRFQNKNYNQRNKSWKISYGVICFKKNTQDRLEFLMVRRKYTYAFLDFLSGKYNLSDIRYLETLFQRMTKDEKDSVLNIPFHDLWCGVWNENDISKYRINYDTGKTRFDILQTCEMMLDGRMMTLRDLINRSVRLSYNYCEWGFPKGKKDGKGENEINAAIREFEEETGVKRRDIIYEESKNYKLFESHTSGHNKTTFRTNLYLAEYKGSEVVFNNFDTIEISEVRWVTKKYLETNLREYQKSILTTISCAEKKIRDHYHHKEHNSRMHDFYSRRMNSEPILRSIVEEKKEVLLPPGLSIPLIDPYLERHNYYKKLLDNEKDNLYYDFLRNLTDDEETDDEEDTWDAVKNKVGEIADSIVEKIKFFFKI